MASIACQVVVSRMTLGCQHDLKRTPNHVTRLSKTVFLKYDSNRIHKHARGLPIRFTIGVPYVGITMPIGCQYDGTGVVEDFRV